MAHLHVHKVRLGQELLRVQLHDLKVCRVRHLEELLYKGIDIVN